MESLPLQRFTEEGNGPAFLHQDSTKACAARITFYHECLGKIQKLKNRGSFDRLFKSKESLSGGQRP